MRYDVLVVGGGPAGIITSVTARKVHGPELKIGLFRPESKTLVPCGIPYMFGTLDAVDKNIMPDKPLEAAKVDIIQDEVVSLDLEAGTLRTASGNGYSFDKLVLATGSEPIVPKDLQGTDLDNVFTIRKSYAYLTEVHRRLADCRDIVIIGGGFIGAEMADELVRREGRDITLIEIMDHCLWQSFDPEFCEMGEKALAEKGVKVLTATKVLGITGDRKVQAVETSDGRPRATPTCWPWATAPRRPIGLALGSAGLTETEARRRGLDVTVGLGESVDRHPGTLPGARPIKVKLVFSTMSGELLGGQVAGGTGVGEMVNVIALAVGQRMEATDLYLMPLGTHPLLTSAPTTYPVVTAAWDYLGRTAKAH